MRDMKREPSCSQGKLLNEGKDIFINDDAGIKKKSDANINTSLIPFTGINIDIRLRFLSREKQEARRSCCVCPYLTISGHDNVP